MIRFREEKICNRTIWIKEIYNSSMVLTSEQIVDYPLYFVEKSELKNDVHEGFTYIVLYDSKMKIIQNAYTFLNFGISHLSYHTRRLYANVLRHLYVFCELFTADVNNLTLEQLLQFKAFVKGIGILPYVNESKIKRSNSTSDLHLTVCRKFFKFFGIKCEALFESHMVSSRFIREENYIEVKQHTQYELNDGKSKVMEEEIPKFISPDEFAKLYKLAKNNDDKSIMILMYLMYIYGLRPGEVLGLTIEDVVERKENGKYYPCLILRNRMSDKHFQYAKLLPHPTSAGQYNSKDYRKLQHKIIIEYACYEMLINYIEVTHQYISRKYPDNYNQSVADIVSTDFEYDQNYYLFLNRYGRRLSQDLLCKSLRKYFDALGIKNDYGKRETNNAHRFRHGFGMFHAHFSKNPVKPFELMKMMRHRSIDSTMKYYNPTQEMIYSKIVGFQQELFEEFPILKEGLN